MSLQDMIETMLGVGEKKKGWRVADPDSLESELERRFGRVTRSHGANGLELICDCPVCGEHKLSVNSVNGIYKCWRGCCSGTVHKLLNKHIPMTEAPVKKAERKSGYIDPGRTIPISSAAKDNPASVYLQSRRFDPQELGKVYSVSYCEEGRTFAGGLYNTANTLLFPVIIDGRVIGWQSRLLYDPDKLDNERCSMLGFKWDSTKHKYKRPPKYFTMPGMNKGEILWNFDNARKSDTVVVTEGVFDAMRVGKCAVATFGKEVSDYQAQLLQQYWKHIVILLDPDAEKTAAKLQMKFAPTADVVQVKLIGYKDAGDAPREVIWSQIADACIAHGSNPGTFNIQV